jgi:DNA-binding SARP family transcriptional activator
MPVEFRVLGPLEIRRNGSPVPLRASKPRTLLGLLLVQHGRVVSVDRLIEGLWPQAPPRGAQHAIETHASRLRTLLGDDLPLVARPPGYVLDVDASSIDSVRFERLLAEARDSEPARAAARATDALALWRGDAYADFTFDSFAQEEIARLDELRADAEEVRIAAELELGRSSELVGELEALVQVDPPRERRYELLMLALYRAGRQQDALDTFQAARTALANYGLEPSAALRELERKILQQDPALDTAPARRTQAPPSRRQVSVVVVAPVISLDLDPEEHERQQRAAVKAVADVATAYGAQQPEPLVLAFVQEDHTQRAADAAGAIRDTLGARVGVESGAAIVGGGSIGGPLVERARARARDDDAPPVSAQELPRRVDGPFVGRDDELARLREAHAVLVVGPPGIGKSRLAHELGRTERVAVGRCSSYGSESLAPLHEVAAHLGSPDALDDVVAAEIPLTFRRLCESAAPVRIVLDDLQWGDALVRETVEHLVAQADASVRVVCLARDDILDDRPGFLPAAERMMLRPLTREESLTLAAELGADDEAVAERADGNPLFIEQLLAHAGEGGTVPATLHSLLAARLDRLGPAELAAIQPAAVIGREFDAELLASLLASESPRASLASLVRRGFLDPIPPKEAFEERFRFRHALIHEVAYESSTKRGRSRLHEAAADLLDARGGSDELIGFHLERSSLLRPSRDRHALRLAEDAGRRLGAAGLERWRRADARGASVLLERAVALLPVEDAQRLELLCELGVARNTVGARAAARTALDGAAASADGRIRLRAELERAVLDALDDGAAVERVVSAAEAAIPVFDGVGDDRALGRAWMLVAWVRGGALARHADSLDAAERALVHYRRAHWPSVTAIAQIASALYFGPTPVAAARVRCEELLAAELTDISREAAVSAYLGGILAMAGAFDESAGRIAHARAIFGELGRTPSLRTTCGPIEAAVARFAGDQAAAAGLALETCKALEAEHASYHLATEASALALDLAALDRMDEAQEWMAVAERHARTSDRQGWISTRIARSRLLALDGAGEDALPLAEEAVTLADATDELNLRAAARIARAEALLVRGEADAASADFDAARSEYARKQNVAAAAQRERRIAAASGGSN